MFTRELDNITNLPEVENTSVTAFFANLFHTVSRFFDDGAAHRERILQEGMRATLITDGKRIEYTVIPPQKH